MLLWFLYEDCFRLFPLGVVGLRGLWFVGSVMVVCAGGCCVGFLCVLVSGAIVVVDLWWCLCWVFGGFAALVL